MNLSLSMPRTSVSAQVSRFMTWHQRHHQDCKETMTNFFSLAALAKTASFHSPQKPSLLSMGAALPAVMANRNGRTNAIRRIMTALPEQGQHGKPFRQAKHTGA